LNFSFRFITDKFFIQSLSKDLDLCTEIIEILQTLHITSEKAFQHNVIFDSCFKSLGRNSEVFNENFYSVIMSAFHPVPNEYDEEIQSCVIKKAIELAAEDSAKVIILTDKNNAPIYTNNKHYNNERVQESVSVLHGDEACKLIRGLLTGDDS